jgi:hypothetical protein
VAVYTQNQFRHFNVQIPTVLAEHTVTRLLSSKGSYGNKNHKKQITRTKKENN